jgi:non-homologous end joining protein Ku
MVLRAIGTAAISLGLVNIPVQIFAPTGEKSLHFHQVHIPCGARIRVQRWCPVHQAEVPLALEILFYPDEIRDPEEIGELSFTDSVSLQAKEKSLAEQLVTNQSAPFRPEEFQDLYRETLRGVVDAKMAGETVAAPPIPTTQFADLMKALEQSLEEARRKQGEEQKAHT